MGGLLLGLVALAGCGARSALDCFGESCRALGSGGSSSDEDGVGNAGTGGRLAPTSPPDVLAPVDPDPAPPTSSRPPREDVLEPDPAPEPPASRLCDTSGTSRQSVQVTNAGELERLQGCSTILGDLSISGFAAEDLQPLGALQIVRGTLAINAYSGKLDGLENLQTVGSLVLDGIDADSLAPLARLRDVGDRAGNSQIYIAGTPNLRTLDGLGAIETLRDLTLEHNSALISLSGLALPADMGALALLDNPALTDLQALANLATVGTLNLEQLGITSLAGLGSLQQAGVLALVNDPGLTSIAELTQLGAVGIFYLDALGLTTVPPLPQLASVSNLLVQDNPNLVDIDNLAGLRDLSELNVFGNASLQRLPSFPAVIPLSQVNVADNPVLGAGPSFPSVTSVDDIMIANNPLLASLAGFSGVVTARSIDINGNASLSALDFGALTSARTFRIICNPALPETVLDPLRNVDGQLNFSNNGDASEICGL